MLPHDRRRDSLVGFMRKTRPLDSHRHFSVCLSRKHRLRHIFTTFFEDSEKRQRKIRWRMEVIAKVDNGTDGFTLMHQFKASLICSSGGRW